MSSLETDLKRKIQEEVPDLSAIAPCLQLQVHSRGKLVADLRYGENYKYFDLASLTKIIFSATVAMRLVENRHLNVNEKVASYWPSWRHKRTRVKDLMTHTAGLPWWLPMYKKLSGPLDPARRFDIVKNELERVKLRSSKKAVYSDPDVWALGAVLCEISCLSLEELWLQHRENGCFGHLHFNSGNTPKYPRRLYAPTERCSWRKKILRGEVHDDNTWAMGGVAPHAGLFGRVEDVASWGLELRKAVRGQKNQLVCKAVARSFTARQIPRERGDFGYIFMKPSRPISSAGRLISLRSFGHTGFTGTSFWYDPVQDVQTVVLSNRVHPTRENRGFVELRPKLHDWVMENLS